MFNTNQGEEMEQKPSIGRIVHYKSHEAPKGQPDVRLTRAAVITEVESEDVVGLAVLNPTGAFFNRGVPYDASGTPGTWNWPPRV
jgi:hypothetical protein